MNESDQSGTMPVLKKISFKGNRLLLHARHRVLRRIRLGELVKDSSDDFNNWVYKDPINGKKYAYLTTGLVYEITSNVITGVNRY